MKLGEIYQSVTLLQAEICGFTKYSSGKEPRQVVEILSRLVNSFDQECNRLKLFKVYTVRDCYVVMGFIDKRHRKQPQEEASDVIQLGLSMLKTMANIKKQYKIDELSLKIGVHTGMIFGGVIGTDIIRFDIYGPDVLILNKLKHGGAENKLCVSQTTRDLLEKLDTTSYVFEGHKNIVIRLLDLQLASFLVGADRASKEEADTAAES